MVEHRILVILFQPVPILKWKWKTITMNFIIGLSNTIRKKNEIMVAVEKLNKCVHFILISSTHKAIDIVEIFMQEIFKLHGMPKVIISNRDAKCTSKFWK